MSLLTIVQDFCRRTNVPVPATVMGSTDDQVKQVRGLLEEVGDDMARRYAWTGLMDEKLHTTVAAEDQGAITTIFGTDFNYKVNLADWDRTNRWPVLGPIHSKEWQSVKAWVVNGPRNQFRIRGGHLFSYPAPSAGNTWAFEYISKNWILDDDGTTTKRRFTEDDDTIRLDEDIILMGLRWRWREEKGLSYEAAFQMYEHQLKDAMNRDGGMPMLHMDQETYRGPTPGIFVPSGSWSLP